MLAQAEQAPIFFLGVYSSGASAQIISLRLAQPWASLKFIFWCLPNHGQVPNLFFGVCPTVGKSQIYFLTFAQLRASLKFIFWRLLNHGQVTNYFDTDL